MNETATAKLDSFARAYVECALWSSSDGIGEPLDRNYGPNDIAPETLASMIADCTAFQDSNELTLRASGIDEKRAGHDFWLTRNGHGSGFWDEYCGIDAALREAFQALTNAAHTYGSFDLYVGDDGRIYGS